MKLHRFQGPGPGYACKYAEGEKEQGEFCNKLLEDPIHVLPVGPSYPPLGGRIAAGLAEAFRGIAPPAFAEPEPQYFPGDARAVWRAHAALVAAKLEEKVAYGSAWEEQGYMGNIGRILSKASRLKNLTWRDEQGAGDVPEGDESVLDTLLDLSALCALAIANIEEGNRWGK